MAFSFSNPLALLMLLPAAAFVIYLFCRYRGKGFHGGIWPLVLRLLLILLLVLSLAGLELKIPVDRTEIVFAADLSDSTVSRQGELADFIADALKILPENYHAGIISFGGNALIEQSLGSRQPFHAFHSRPDTDYSNIEQALQRAEGLFTQDSSKRIVLLTDGAENLGDALLRAGVLRQRGISVDVFHLDTVPPEEVQLSGLTLPSSLYQGESYDIQIEINSTVETRGILRLYANRLPVDSREVEIQKGRNIFLFRREAETVGTVIYEAELEPLSGHDTFLQNNRTASYARIEGPPMIALVEGQEGEGRELAGIMDAGGLEYRIFLPHTLPDQLEELVKFDAVILANVGIDELGHEKTEILDNYVRSMGRGLLVTGGDNSYALGGYLGTRLEEMLPVDMDLSKRKEIPSLALALVIDKSGSMSDTQFGINKMELAKEAAIRSTEALRDDDFIGVAVFDSAAAWVVEMQKVINREDIQDAIATIQPGGGTNMYPGLDMAYQALKNTDAALKHVIVLTDGHTGGGNFDSLVTRMAAEGMTVSGVAVGKDADGRLMEHIAALGKGRYYFTDDYAGIPKIFTKETYMAARSYINNETFYPQARGGSAILAGIESVPSLDGYLTTTIKGGAVPVLVSRQDDDPILAYWDYGLGKVAAWTSDAKGIWTERWLKWEQAASFWLNTISSVLPGSSGEGGRIETGRTGNTGHIAVSTDEQDSGSEIYAVVVNPDGGESRVRMLPSRPGYYQGNFALDSTGVYLVRVEQRRDDGTAAAMEGALIYPYSPEYDIDQAPSRNLAEHIAGRTGGLMIEKPEDLLLHQPAPVWRHHEIWPALLLIALLIFLLDIVLRRLGLRFVLDRVNSFISKSVDLLNKKKESKKTEISDEVLDRTRNETKKEEHDDSIPAKRDDFTSALLKARQERKIRK